MTPDPTEPDDTLKAALAALSSLADEIAADTGRLDETIERLLTEMENTL